MAGMGSQLCSLGVQNGAGALTTSLLLSSRSTLCTAGQAPASRKRRRSLLRGSSPTRQYALQRPTLLQVPPPMPSGHPSWAGAPASHHTWALSKEEEIQIASSLDPRVSASAVRGCLIPAWKCWCLNSLLLYPLSSRMEAVLVCAGPVPSADWGRSGMGGAVAKPCACHHPPFQHQLLGAGASSRRVTGTRTEMAAYLPLGSSVSPPSDATCVPWGMKVPLVPSPSACRGWLLPEGFCLPSLWRGT